MTSLGNCAYFDAINVKHILMTLQPRKPRPFLTERLLMGRKESNQTNKCSRKLLTGSVPTFSTSHTVKHQWLRQAWSHEK